MSSTELRCGKGGSVTQKLYNAEKLAKKGHLLACPLAEECDTIAQKHITYVLASIQRSTENAPNLIMGWHQWWRYVINLGVLIQATSLPPSILFSSLPSSGFSRGYGQSTLTRCQTFWCNLYSLTKSRLMFHVLQKSTCVQGSATVGRTDTMDYRPCTAAWH